MGCKRAKLARKDLEEHDNEKMKEHLMMTKDELTKTKAQLDAALKQINSLATLVNKHLYPFQLDTMATNFKPVCPVTIKMTECKHKKENSIQWYSDPFYTHNNGYKMCLRIDAAGYGVDKGTHLSVFLYLMKGPHDDELTWPLRGNFEVKLLNQISDNEHYSMIIGFDDVRVVEGNRATRGWGYQRFISYEHKSTPACRYLKADCLFFQVTKL